MVLVNVWTELESCFNTLYFLSEIILIRYCNYTNLLNIYIYILLSYIIFKLPKASKTKSKMRKKIKKVNVS